MAVTKENLNDSNSAQSSAAAVDSPAAKVPDAKPKKFHTHGHRIHNELTYRGIDWLLNSSVGITTSYWAEKTKPGEKYFGVPVTKFFDKILKPVIKDDVARLEGATWGKRFASIMAGGFTIIPLMMLMENKKRKRKIVRYFDEKIYGRDTVANDPKFEESYCKIDDEPKKGFWTGMAARMIAITPLITVAVIKKTNDPLIKYVYDPIGKATQGIARKLTIPAIKTLNKTVTILEEVEPGIKKNVVKDVLPDGMLTYPRKGHTPASTDRLSNWDFLHRTIGFDLSLTVFYAIFHEIAYKTLAAFSANKHKEHDTAALAAVTHHSGATTASSSPEVAAHAATRKAADGGKSWADKSGGPKQAAMEKTENFVTGVDKSRIGEQPAMGV